MQYIVYNTYYTLHSIQIGGDRHGHTEEERCIGGMRPFGLKERSFVWLPDHTGCFRLHRGTDSTMYPILRRLESGGYVTTYSMEHNGRTRKYFQITDTGVQKIQDFLDEWDEMKQIYAFVGRNFNSEGQDTER